MKNIFLATITGYEYISKMLPASCSYYPTCTKYAKWQFEFSAPHRAFASSSLRILRCNQLFPGGIDYPLVEYTPPPHLNILSFNPFCGKIDITYWLVPQNTTVDHPKYYVVKDFDAIKRTT